MKAEELYKKEFGSVDSVPKESVIRLLKHFARALEIERKKALLINSVSDTVCDHTDMFYRDDLGRLACKKCRKVLY